MADEHQRVTFLKLNVDENPATQARYNVLSIPTVILFEGWDAAGKGTVIQRLAEKLDPRAFRAWPGAPPSELDRPPRPLSV